MRNTLWVILHPKHTLKPLSQKKILIISTSSKKAFQSNFKQISQPLKLISTPAELLNF